MNVNANPLYSRHVIGAGENVSNFVQPSQALLPMQTLL